MFKTKFSSSDTDFQSSMQTPQLIKGEDGFSPIVVIKEVEGGHQVEITDSAGTQTFVVQDGIIGKDGQDGKDGKDGYTPKKGIDYYTEQEKRDLVEQIETEVIGDIDQALESIIAIQNELMSG